MKITPVELPSIVTSDFLTAVEMFSSESMEAFQYKPNRLIADKIGKQIEKLDAQSTKAAIACFTTLSDNMYAQERQLSARLNSILEGLFVSNKERIKQLNADIKNYKRLIEPYRRRMRDKTLSDEMREDAEAQFNEMSERMDRAYEIIRKLKVSLYLPVSIFNALSQCMSDMKTQLNTLIGLYKKYKDTVDIMEDPAHFKHYGEYGDTFEKTLSECLENLEHLSDALEQVETSVEEKARREIYGKTIEPNYVNDIPLDQSILVEINKIYSSYRSVMAFLHKRLFKLKKLVQDIQNGIDVDYTYSYIFLEGKIIFYFAMYFNEAMTFYMRAPFSVMGALNGQKP